MAHLRHAAVYKNAIHRQRARWFDLEDTETQIQKFTFGEFGQLACDVHCEWGKRRTMFKLPLKIAN